TTGETSTLGLYSKPEGNAGEAGLGALPFLAEVTETGEMRAGDFEKNPGEADVVVTFDEVAANDERLAALEEYLAELVAASGRIRYDLRGHCVNGSPGNCGPVALKAVA